MSFLEKHLPSLRKRRGLLIIIIAALLLESLSAAQYFFTRKLLGEELEKRAESELTTKAILIKSTLNASEDILNSHLWDIRRSLSHPDSVYLAVTRMMLFNRYIKGAGVGFVPNYFPSEGRLYEPYSTCNDDTTKIVVTRQIANENHDYTKSVFWQKAIEADSEAVWVEPYIDNEGAGGLVTSYATTIYDDSKNLAGVAAIDVSLEWLRDTIDTRYIYPSSFVLLLTEDGKPIIQPSEKRVSSNTSEDIIRMINDLRAVELGNDNEGVKIEKNEKDIHHYKSRSGRSTVIHFDSDGRDGTVFLAYMKGKPHWQLAVVCYDDEVYASLAQLRIWLTLLMLLAFGILLFVVWRFARSEKNLQSKTLEEERMAGELRIASDIQQALLPLEEPSLVGVGDVSVEGRQIPAKAVGGDLYNVFVRDGKLFFCIGDVSGKGIPAALIMAITQALFRNIAERESNPAHIMSQINENACRKNKTNVFVTLFIGVLDLPTGHLRYCNAGHEVPILTKGVAPSLASTLEGPSENDFLDVLPNLPIGLFEDFKYEMQETVMQTGETLFLYTDGLTEARDTKRKLFGKERVKQMMAHFKTTDVKDLVDSIVAEVIHFSENIELGDDLTLLAIRYTPAEEQYVLDETLTLKNDVSEVAKLSTFVKDVMARLNIGKPLASNLRLALEEAVVNVMEYAYPAGMAGDVNIRVTCSTATSENNYENAITHSSNSIQHLKFIITDSGVSFNPTEVAIADTTLSAEERPVGGLGILLVRELMDSINYERIDGKNVLTLTKIIAK